MPQLKQFVTCFSLQRPGFNYKAIHVEFVVEKVVLGQVSLRAFWSPPANYHSTTTPFSHPSSGAGTVGPLAEAPRHSVSPHPKEKKCILVTDLLKCSITNRIKPVHRTYQKRIMHCRSGDHIYGWNMWFQV
jgi:hypothetical protein